MHATIENVLARSYDSAFSFISVMFYVCNNVCLQSTEAADLRRAYRKLSLQLHPDKNKEPDAEIKFRQVPAQFLLFWLPLVSKIY